MSDPIDYLVVRNLQAALGAMTVVGGYHYDLAGTAVKLDPNHKVEDFIKPDGPRPFVILDLQPEDWNYQPAKQLRLVMPVRVHWVGESTVTDDTSRMRTFLCGCADIERAVAADVTRGGLAVDTRIVRRQADDSTEGAQVWAIVDLEITLYRTYGQPDG